MSGDLGTFITLHRKITEWEWYTDGNTFRLFIHLLIKANHAESKWRGEVIRRGELLTGLLKLSEETGISVSGIRTALKHLISTSEVTERTTNKYRIITINNYDTYQAIKVEGDKQGDKQSDKQVTSNRQASDKQVTTSNKNNNDNNDNNECKRGKKAAFQPPTKREALDFFESNGSGEDEAARFWYHYDANGWMAGRVKMKSWTSAAHKWIRTNHNGNHNGHKNSDSRSEQDRIRAAGFDFTRQLVEEARAREARERDGDGSH